MKGIVLVPISEKVCEPKTFLSRICGQQGLADHLKGLQSRPTKFPKDCHVAHNLVAFARNNLGETPHTPLLFARFTLNDFLRLVRESVTFSGRRLFHLTVVRIAIPVPLYKILAPVECARMLEPIKLETATHSVRKVA